MTQRRPESVPVAVFASGGGTNFQALLDRLSGARQGAAHVAVLVSDRSDAGALHRAERAGVPSRVVEVRDRRVEDVAADTLAVLEEHGVGLVALAGYLRLVPAAVVARYRGRMLNVHPALLPAFGGRGMYGSRIHEAVLAAGARVTGVTVHQVDEEYDRGPIVAQWPVPVLPGDTPERLARRVLRVEHRIYPLALEAVARRLGHAVVPGPTSSGDLCFELADEAVPAETSLRRLVAPEQTD